MGRMRRIRDWGCGRDVRVISVEPKLQLLYLSPLLVSCYTFDDIYVSRYQTTTQAMLLDSVISMRFLCIVWN